MYKAEVDLKLISNMFSTGADKGRVEFRIPELKALLRITFREFFYYIDLKDLESKESALFGSTNNKAPVNIKFRNTDWKQSIEKSKLVLHKENFESYCIKENTQINLMFESYDREWLELYMLILNTASITGGLGKRARKGLGAFRVDKIEIKDSKEQKDIVESEKFRIHGFEDVFSKDKEFIKITKVIGNKTYNYELREFKLEQNDNISKYEFNNSKLPDIHYVKRLYILKIQGNSEKTLEKISELTHERLKKIPEFMKDSKLKEEQIDKINKDILGNCNKTSSRFASPVYITLHQESNDEGKKIDYLVIKEINYNYIYEGNCKSKNSQQFKDLDAEYVKTYIEKLKELTR